MRVNHSYAIPLFTAFVVSCSQLTLTSNPEDQPIQEVAATRKSLDQFWRDFQSALKKGDISEISRLTRFPLDVNLSDIEGFNGIENREGFVRHFGTLFPEPAIRTLLRTSPHSIDVDANLGGPAVESWIICHNEPNKVSEMEWSIIYYFSRFPDGGIRMTAIHFAG